MVRARILIALFLVAAVVAAPVPSPPVADAVLPVGRIAFTSMRTGDAEIYLLSTLGGRVENLTRDPGSEDVDPAWSPDGTRLAWARRRNNDPSFDIWVMTADGRGRSPLTSDFGGPIDRQPTWSPDGRRIAWARAVGPTGISEIWSMRANGRNPVRVTRSRRGSRDWAPAWSPTGNRIAFVSDRAGGSPEVYMVNADGSGRRRLTRNRAVDGSPSWSPDGTRLAIERRPQGGTSSIRVLHVATGRERRITRGAHAVQPTWSPDGARVAFARFPRRGGGKELYQVALGGSLETPITAHPRADLQPTWHGGLLGGLVQPDLAPGGGGSGGTGSVPARKRGARGPLRVRVDRKVIPGLRFQRIRDRRTPNDIHVLRVNPARRARMDVALGGNRLPGFERTTSMAARHGAVAAINGDFPVPSNGRPSHPYAEDGDLKQSSFAVSENVALRGGGRGARIARPFERITVLERDSGDAWWVDRWNDGSPTPGETAAFTPAGGILERPPRHACAARLRPTGGRRWAPDREGVSRDFVVDAVSCRRSRMRAGNGVVIASGTGTPTAPLIASLTRGESLTLTWTFGWRGVADSMGGIPLLVSDGAKVVRPCSQPICSRHPRTGIGVTGNGRILLVVVDGRRPGSRGMTLSEFADLFRRLGARHALNLDGGGSSTMVVRGRVVNAPSDGSERNVCCAFLVLDGPDRRQRIGDPSITDLVQRSAHAGSWPADGRAAALDPASTGGMLDAVVSEAFGPRYPVPLPPELRSALRVFRESLGT